MTTIYAFLQLIRWVNLLFILIAQWLFRYCIVLPVFHYYEVNPVLSDGQFVLVAFATVLIAAGGYIINDYFDVKIDQINKPKRLLIDRFFPRRQAIVAHWLFSLAGILLGGFVAWWVGRVHLGALFAGASFLLWWYSAWFKRQPLIGNVVVSFLTALTIVVVALFEIWIIHRPAAYDKPAMVVLVFVMLYGGFAFLISMVREIVKDIEDWPGDAAHHCKTLPVVAGVRSARLIAALFSIVLIIFAVAILIEMRHTLHPIVLLYGWLAIVLPQGWVIYRLLLADRQRHFRQLSTWIKVIMMLGILSMALLYYFDHSLKGFLL